MRFFRRGVTVFFSKASSGPAPSPSKEFFEANIELPIFSGWHLVRVIGACNSTEAFLQVDCGLGFEDSLRFSLNCCNGQLTRSVADLPQGILAMRLVLKVEERVESAESVALSLTPIFKLEALVRVTLYQYQRYRMWDISARQFLYEKWHQIRKVGIGNITRNLSVFYDYSDTARPLSYQQWLQKREHLDHDSRQHIFSHSFTSSPLCSIVCKPTNDPGLLAKTVESLRRQVYRKWQLLVVVDQRISAESLLIIQGAMTDDERVSLMVAENPPTSNLIAETLSRMDGEFGLWMDAGEQLSPFALYYWVKAINIRSEAIVWYCDSDQLTQDGERHTPCFRPSWNRELFYSQEYIGSGCLFHLPTVRQCCNPGKLIKHAERFDLLLHILEYLPEERIGHVARVLYHKQDHQWVGGDRNIEQQRKALVHHFKRLGKDVQVKSGALPYSHRLLYTLPNELPSVTLIIPTRDQVAILKKCVGSILKKTSYPAYNIIIVNNGSTAPETFAYFEHIGHLHKVKILDYDHLFNFAAINNFAASKADAEIIGLLNNDIEVISPDWLYEMVRYVNQEKVGCVGAKLLYSNGSIQHAGVICGLGNVAGHAHRYLKRDEPGYFGRLQSSQYFSAVTAACLLVRRKVWDEVDGMNEKLGIAYNDVDFCLRVKKTGYKNVYTPYAELYHHESLSRGLENTPEKRARYQQEFSYMWKTWQNELENDEYYNPNLSRVREDFSL